MTTRDKERLALGALCLLAFGFAGGDVRFGGLERYAWMFAGLTAGWLIKSFLPEPEKMDAMSYGIRLAVSLIGVLVFMAIMVFIGGLLATRSS